MKFKYLKMFAIFVVLFLDCYRTVETVAETIRLTNGQWPPYFSKFLPHYGVGSQIVTEAFALEGIEVTYVFFPWKRGLKLAQNGTFDGAVGWQTNTEREQYFYASETIWQAPWVFFHLKKVAFDWHRLTDLAPLKIGGTLEYMYTPQFLAAERAGQITVDRAVSDEAGWKKLVAGRIDVFPQLIDVGYFQIQKLFDPDTMRLITHHPRIIGLHAEQLLLSRKIVRNKRLLTIFNRGVQRLKESGRYDQYSKALRESAFQNKKVD